MKREPYEICLRIMGILKKAGKREMNVNSIVFEVRAQRTTVLRALNFLKKLELVSERKGDTKTSAPTRLFKLRKGI